ncbi:hypothetical protein [Hymenobacter sp. CRA2]|uniref:hypothetical protein n=1 Tax=Hymenobacter sp. CRA2 TaxID=1955620 RepID=UPI00098F6CF0|nr:hypothetical protein [Hymenobacter sp. CRA2]OON70022.1 hypothetical protein B0919_04550 [Hymenobacter sp. CRA2]
MKYLFTLVLFVFVHHAQAQIGLLMGGVRAASAAATIAARQKKAQKNVQPADAAAPATPAAGPGVTPFSFRGQSVPRKRTEAATFKGKGGAEIQALEAALEEIHVAFQADSVKAFLTAAHTEAVIAANRKAVAVRPNWNYAPYQQELAFYQKEEARRQQPAGQPASAK